MNNMGIIINNPKSGGGKSTDYLAIKIQGDENYSYTNYTSTKITSYAFYNDQQLTSVNFPNVTSISSYVFYGCSQLTSVNFPNVTSIGNYSFQYCTSLINISFPSATSIGNSAFAGCTALQSITLGASTVCTLSATNAIPATASHHITIYVPSDLIASYQAATNWSTLYNNGYITFSAITDGSTHTVSVSSFSEGGNCNTYYSLDNGSTWTEITGTGTLSSNATQIKFRCVSVGGAPETCTISSATLSLDFSQSLMSSGTYETSNYTLTSDVTDIVIDEAEIVLPD